MYQTKLVDNFHWIFLLLKYLALWMFGWFVPGVITGIWLIGIASVLFLVFDICALALWYLVKKTPRPSVLQQVLFYFTQLLCFTVFFVVFFQPSLITDLATYVLDTVL